MPKVSKTLFKRSTWFSVWARWVSNAFRRPGESLGRMENESSKRVNLHVSAPQRTELREAVIHDSAIHVYHQGEVHFAVRVGERIPDSIEFFAPPPRLVEIDPEFRRYRIVVLDTKSLVVDPATREIVDVIPT